MDIRHIEILEASSNEKGDLFGRLMADLFHCLGYSEPRFNIHKPGRELDIRAVHRTEKKITIAECKATGTKIGGSDINKFIGALDAEKRKINTDENKTSVQGYFISLSGFTETAIEQENEQNNERVILMTAKQVIQELINGRILVPFETAVSTINNSSDIKLMNHADIVGYEKGWVWVIYYSNCNNQKATHFALVHADGKPLIADLANQICELDKSMKNLFSSLTRIEPEIIKCADYTWDNVKEKYFKYLQTECGEIQFEGMPTDKDAGSVRVNLENIFIPVDLIKLESTEQGRIARSERLSLGTVLENNNRIAILAKPGGGKSTLLKRIAIAYAFPDRLKMINDNLPQKSWIPIFIRCRELGDRVTNSITDIINSIPNRAEISHLSEEFKSMASDALQKGNVLLLIDGLDEISEDRNRVMFVSQLRTFVATYPNINIITTSREAGFRIVAETLTNYCTHYSVAPLSRNDIEQLSIKWHSSIIDNSDNSINEAKKIASLILKEQRILTLAENPLLLTTLLFVKRWAGYLPTKISVLYQEMIKLLLVTWNVQGHDQLDIDEAEPQLAFIAHWMMINGQQTISMEDLKQCLIEARQQMPEILGFTKISPTDFIKRVESRSSLLIMTGVNRLDNGQLSQVYEFLHLSFQEYLAAKAIAKKYIPSNLSSQKSADLVKPHFDDERWKEVIPLTAVLLERDSKDIIEPLIEHLKANFIPETSHHNTLNVSSNAAKVLTNCIVNEVQIGRELLEKAIEWWAKYRGGDRDPMIEILLNNKYGEICRSIPIKLFHNSFEEKYLMPLGSIISDIYLHDIKSNEPNVIYTKFLEDIAPDKPKEIKCNAILGMMKFAFTIDTSKRKTSRNTNLYTNEKYDEIFAPAITEMLRLLNTDDRHYYFSVCWSLCWATGGGFIEKKNTNNFANSILRKWLTDEVYPTARMASWSLAALLTPNTKIEMIEHDNLLKVVNYRLLEPRNRWDREASLYIKMLLLINSKNSARLEILEDCKKIMDDTSNRSSLSERENFNQFLKSWDIDPKIFSNNQEE